MLGYRSKSVSVMRVEKQTSLSVIRIKLMNRLDEQTKNKRWNGLCMESALLHKKDLHSVKRLCGYLMRRCVRNGYNIEKRYHE